MEHGVEKLAFSNDAGGGGLEDVVWWRIRVNATLSVELASHEAHIGCAWVAHGEKGANCDTAYEGGGEARSRLVRPFGIEGHRRGVGEGEGRALCEAVVGAMGVRQLAAVVVRPRAVE